MALRRDENGMPILPKIKLHTTWWEDFEDREIERKEYEQKQRDIANGTHVESGLLLNRRPTPTWIPQTFGKSELALKNANAPPVSHLISHQQMKARTSGDHHVTAPITQQQEVHQAQLTRS